MHDQPTCKTCGTTLIQKQTKPKTLNPGQTYYYSAYYYCPHCQKIYHDNKFRVETKNIASPQSPLSPTLLNKKDIDVQIWTDGACVHNGTPRARASWAFVSGETEQAGLVEGPKQTNNVAEGLAILQALKWAAEKGHKTIQLHTDSQISLYNVNKPAHLVKENRGIFEQIEQTIKTNHLTVYYEKVPAHSTNINNNRADRLANQLAVKNN